MPMPEKKKKRKRRMGRMSTAPRLIRVRPAGSKKKKMPCSEAAQPVYLVLEHSGDSKPFYSVIEAASGAAAYPIKNFNDGMSFAAVESARHGPRIVGVGLATATVYNPKTSREIGAPPIFYPKLKPVLIAHGSKLYALSRIPSVVMGVDFMPWFFVLDLDESYATTGTVRGTMWLSLPPPPVFPCRLNPLEYRDPPEYRVAAYAVVGSHILLSVSVQPQQQDKGTCAFDVDTNEWEMVDDKNLPFVGQAEPLGNHHFLACSEANGGAATVYYMQVFKPGTSGTGKTELSLIEVAVVSEGIVPGQLLCSMGKDSFSSFHIPSEDPKIDAKRGKARIIHRTYSQIFDAETQSTVIMKQQEHIFKLRDPYNQLDGPTRVVAAVAMDKEW